MDFSLSPSSCRQWTTFPQKEAEPRSLTFTIASYNILSEELLKRSSYFNKIKPEHWHRESRHVRLMEELDGLNADILCLQEVDKDYWTQPLAATSTTGSGRLSDLVLARIQQLGVGQHQAELLDYVDAPQRYHIARLEHRTTGRRLTVGNAHISYQRPAKWDLRAAQAAAMTTETAAVASGEAFLVCGDFNSTPESLAYQSVMTGSSPHLASVTLADQQLPLLKAVPEICGQLSGTKGFNMRSAYLSVFGKEPDCTLNLTNNSGCVDFIFYETGRLQPLAALEVPSWYILRDKDCAPDANLASDHLSIAAKFIFI